MSRQYVTVATLARKLETSQADIHGRIKTMGQGVSFKLPDMATGVWVATRKVAKNEEGLYHLSFHNSMTGAKGGKYSVVLDPNVINGTTPIACAAAYLARFQSAVPAPRRRNSPRVNNSK